MKPRTSLTPSQQAVVRDMETALRQENYVYALRMIHANRDIAPRLRAMWQKQADAQWEQELADDAEQLMQGKDQEAA